MDKRFFKFRWESPTRFSDEEFESFDFSGTDFTGVFFINSTFKNCLFEKGTPGNLAFFGCDFRDCTFTGFDFRRISVGAEGGLFEGCQFKKCNFTGRHFEYPHFENCDFDHCKLKGVNFNDASFSRCRFIGKIEDSTFNGLYHKKSTGHPPLREVDFSKAILGDFVTFENCDLSTCIPPEGREFSELLYQIYKNKPGILSTGSPDRIVIQG
ncbi:pentapeptide repeat-containing protein [Pyxidicoccus fallax]|uniref:Pentapeptide repeat-containing protein n=1 Tax=Pyxidicoccus fallax TaxID=394095 RepID=A0A848LGB6_9BACT|nr:pentapeptide repeat-containing protein [Pyxidicoccus fallax]NMO16265.1 pentapeptide repeat-containing protein [Pyxidicoccus fallax]NPC78664.1 pentapeptide repeat-containing protein [Pyxidicoccus fallax]